MCAELLYYVIRIREKNIEIFIATTKRAYTFFLFQQHVSEKQFKETR